MASTKKKPATKKTAVKRPAAKKAAKLPAMRSFQRTNSDVPFLTFQITNQTIYWLILSLLVLALGAWVMYLNVKVQRIYDQIDLTSSLQSTNIVKHKKQN